MLNIPSFGKWASSDHHTRSAFCRISSYLQNMYSSDTCITAHLTHTEALTPKGLFTLCVEGILPLLVLGNFVGLVLLALLAVGSAGLRHIHLDNQDDKQICNIPGGRLKVHSLTIWNMNHFY